MATEQRDDGTVGTGRLLCSVLIDGIPCLNRLLRRL